MEMTHLSNKIEEPDSGLLSPIFDMNPEPLNLEF